MPLLVAEAGLELVAALGLPWVVAEREVQRSMVDELHVEQGECLEQGLTGKRGGVQGRMVVHTYSSHLHCGLWHLAQFVEWHRS